jgi:hypothetical protein
MIVTGRVCPWDLAVGREVECFARGAFGPPGHLCRWRIALRWLRDQEEIAFATRWWDDHRGLYAAFQLVDGSLAEHALAMITAGVRGLSVSFAPLDRHVRLDGVRKVRARHRLPSCFPPLLA